MYQKYANAFNRPPVWFKPRHLLYHGFNRNFQIRMMDISHPTVQAVPLARDRSSRKPAPLPGLPAFHIICKSPCIPQTCFVPLCRQGNLDPNLSPLRLPGTPRPPSTRDHPWLGLTSFVYSSSPALHNPSRLPTEPGVSSTPPAEPYNIR
jgi:hypothetical protein